MSPELSIDSMGSTKKSGEGRGGARGTVFALLTVLLCTAHSLAIWQSLEGAKGLTNGWPLWRDDHPLYYHSALVTRDFLKLSWTTAGYDPSFMSGYPKSVVFPASSTLPELVVAFFGGTKPELAYKVYVLLATALVPWLIGLAALAWRIAWEGVFVSVAVFLVYLWTDFPINYATFGMLPYLLAIPLALLATAVFSRFLESGSVFTWLISAGLMTLAVMVHFTSAMVAAPAALVATMASWHALNKYNEPFPKARWVGVGLIPLLVIVGNAFWWLPGLWLAKTKGPSDFAFVHPEGVVQRLIQIVQSEARVELVLIVAGLLGFVVMRIGRHRPLHGLATFLAMGFAWGYLAGSSRSLDFLQPGRHTYAFYSGLCVASGLGVSIGCKVLRERFGYKTDWVFLTVLLGLGGAYFGQDVQQSLNVRVFSPIPFLSSRPSPRLLWVMSRVKKHVAPGERLLYEEGGFGIPGLADPYQGGRFSGLLPSNLGIELIGGPYLHAALTTNFTQFGEGKLFGKADWDRDWFVRYAKLYRPAAMLCWTPRSRAFCRDNPDLIEIKEDEGTLMLARVKGFAGDAIRGEAEVRARPGTLQVTGVKADLDGYVVLRYHSVPCLWTNPPMAWDSVSQEGDPVPFIRLRPPLGTTTFELRIIPSVNHRNHGPP